MSNILIFKLLFLIILIIFTIYILYYECKFKDINNKGEILQSVIRIPKPIRDLIFIYGSGTLTYYQILKGASQENISKVKDKEISELKEEIGKLKDINNEERNQYVSLISNLIGDRYQIRDLVRRQEEFIENIDMINQLKEKKEKGEILSVIESKLLERESSIKEEMSMLTKETSEKKEKLDKIIEELTKSSFINVNFNFDEILSSLSREELLALGSLLFNSLIFSYTITIITIIYGDYLIKRFDLENKYPKLHKFIKIRRQLQNYYLKLCFAWIFIGLLPQIFVYICILYPKLIELF